MTPLTARELEAEVARGRAKFPSGRFLMVGLVEEVGELVDAIILRDRFLIQREAIQVATVAIRIAEEGDAIDYSRSDLAKLVSAVGATAKALLQRRKDTMLTAIGIIAKRMRENEKPDATFDSLTAEETQP